MVIWALLLAALAVILLLAVLVILRRTQAQLEALQGRASLAPAIPPSGSTRPIITIEILNPFELAAARAPGAGLVAKLAPRAIERVVYKITVDMLREEIVKHGVTARVSVHDVD